MSESNLADFFLQNCEEGVVAFDSSLVCTHWNPAMERITGYLREECLGKQISCSLYFWGESGETPFFSRALEGKSGKVDNQLLIVREKGLCKNISVKFSPFKEASGEKAGGVLMLQETGQNSADIQQKKETGQNYMGLDQHSPKAVLLFTAGEILFVNHKMPGLLGYDNPSEMVGKPPLSIVADQEREEASMAIKQILSQKKQESRKCKLVKKDGSVIDTEVSCQAINYMDQQVVYAGIHIITENEKAFNELVKHKHMLNEAQSIARLGSYQLNISSLESAWTEGLYRILEIKPDEFSPTLEKYLNFAEEPDREQLLRLFHSIKNGDLKEASHIHKIVLPNGKEKQVKVTGKPKNNKTGEIKSIVGTVQDITELRKVEEELFRANQILNLHFENSPLGFIQLNSQLQLTGWSKQAEIMFGWKPEEVIGKNLLSLKFVHEESLEYFKSQNQKKINENFNYKKSEIRFYTKKETVVYCDLFMSGILGEDGKVHSVLLLLNDVTSRQLSEQARLDGQMEERKRIAREIHDGIGQMLIAIKYKLAGLEDTIPETDHYKIQNLEGMMEQTLEEVRSVSRNLAPRSVATLGLETSLRQMCDQIKKLTAIDITFRYIGGEREINNVIVNALYRIAQEATHNIIKHAQASVANIQVFQGRNFIELKVEDNGKGITYTGSNGMGMKNMEERTKLLGGRFQIHSEPGFGTSLIVNVPLDQQEKK